MKRKICLIMVTVMVMFAVAGCGNSAGKAEEKVDDPKPEVSAVEDQSAEDSDGQERPEEVEEASDTEEGSESAEDNEAEPAEAGDDQSVYSKNETVKSDEPAKDGNTPITDEDIAELKSYIKEAVITEYLEPNGLTVEQLVWSEDSWNGFF